jgi:hypothetical protein
VVVVLVAWVVAGWWLMLASYHKKIRRANT